MKKFFPITLLTVTVCLFLSSGNAAAQWHISANAGADLNAHIVDNQFAYDYRYSPGWGYAFGVGAGYRFTDWFSLDAELDAVSKNFNMTRSGQDSGIFENQSNLYLKIPVLASFSFGGKRVRGFLNAGPYMGVQVFRKKTGSTRGVTAGDPSAPEIYRYTIINDFSSKADNLFDAGATLGLGIGFLLTDKLGLGLEIRDYQSFIGTKKSSSVVSTIDLNNTCAVLLSISYQL